jgi:hypothetical protein
VSTAPDIPVTGLSAHLFTIPTDAPEADGALSWSATTVLVAEVSAAGWAAP